VCRDEHDEHDERDDREDRADRDRRDPRAMFDVTSPGSHHRQVALAIACFVAVACCPDSGAAEPQPGLELFERKIRPVLIRECYSCHSSASTELKGGLRVDSRVAIRRGGETGPAVVPRQINKSLLIDAIEHRSLEMPPKKKLPKTVIADFRKWIALGAPDPRDKPPTAEAAAAESWELVLAERRSWWSLQPAARVEPPRLGNNDWSQREVDRFVLAGLRRQQLQPAEDAEPLILLRRLAFILTGLPPDPEQVRSFPARWAADREQALGGVVDELLRSPHFGERMARHWMDVVRYTDTYGYEWDNPARGSWEYRDYLVRAFNDDIGFDQLIKEQVAGDLLPAPRISESSGLNESLIGPMFFHMGEHRHGDNVRINGVREEMIDNKIDAFSKAFLSMTVACARCHDHKLDAVSQHDYYALAGMFMTPRWTARSIEAPQAHRSAIGKLKSLRSKIAARLKSSWAEQAERFGDEVAGLHKPAEKTTADTKSRADLWRKALGLTPPDAKARAKPPQPPQPLAEASGLDGLIGLVAGLSGARTEEEARSIWKQFSGTWKSLAKQRRASNLKAFKPLGDLVRDGWPSGWVIEGDGMKHGRVAHGTPLVALEGQAVVTRLLRAGYHTHSLSSRLPGAVRMTLQQDVPGKHVSLELAGGEWSGSIRMADNAFQTEAVKFFDRPSSRWEQFADIALANGIQRVSYDVVTSDLNPNFPPRTGVARAEGKRLPDKDLGIGKRSWFGVTGIVTHARPGQPADELTRFATLLAGEPPRSTDEAFRRIARWLARAVGDWAGGDADADDVRLVNWLMEHRLLVNEAGGDDELARLLKEYREIEAAIPLARTANSMDERGVVPVDYLLNIRGSIHDRGRPVPRRFLQVFSREVQPEVIRSHGSGRLQLAEFLVSQRHALAARVHVNRIWQWVFGSGLVRTPSDFGRLGDRPSHPELLDFLAREFVAQGWSTKTMIRRLVLSRTFRQSGRVSPRGREIDPSNRLLHHVPTRRLEAEAIRDTLLAVSGRLDPTLYGRPINPHRHAEDSAKRLFSGPLDGRGRRSIYLSVSIMAPSTFLLNFNFPDPKLPAGRRDVTNVPAQALVLLNDPFVVSLARRWAGDLVKDDSKDVSQRIERMFIRALSRPPRPDETNRWRALVKGLSGDRSADVMHDEVVWKDVAHTMLNTKEFIYFR